MVFVGTGKLLGASDFCDVQMQSVYGIVDPMTARARSIQVRCAIPSGRSRCRSSARRTRTVTCTGSTAQCGSADGWVVDPARPAGERVNVEMELARGTLVVASNVPRTALRHRRLQLAQLPELRDRPAGEHVGQRGIDLERSTRWPRASRVLSIGGRLVGDRRFTNATDSRPDDVPFDTPPPTGKRVSWREIAQ